VELTRASAHLVARAGLILVPEGRQVFPQLTVAENLRLGATRRGDFRKCRDRDDARTVSAAAPTASHGGRSVVGRRAADAGGCARLLARPDMLLLDEPSLGLAPAVAAELFGQFTRLRDEGMTLLIVDQMADHVLAIADRGYVLGGGRVVAQGEPAGTTRMRCWTMPILVPSLPW
jgi:branched-chain amino acid transport system ATP-binding protein